MPSSKKNSKRLNGSVKNGNRRLGGPSPKPTRTLCKKFAYNEIIQCDNATSTYAFYSKYMKPDITKAVGSLMQFDAYELWRLRAIKVSIQCSASPSAASSFSPINTVAGTNIWTAPDYGTNETVSGESIMQYQNAKRNTLSLNSWKQIVNTDSRINASLDTNGDWNFIMARDTWVNTSKYDSSFYSGYQLFIQQPGFQNFSPSTLPAFNLQTTLVVEFLQPAFQAAPSTFTQRVFQAILKVQLSPITDPGVFTTYKFSGMKTFADPVDQTRKYKVTFVDVTDNTSFLHFDDEEMLTLYQDRTFNNVAIIYDGPKPDTFRDF